MGWVTVTTGHFLFAILTHTYTKKKANEKMRKYNKNVIGD